MLTTSAPSSSWQQMAHDHLMLHFTDMARLRERDVPMLVRGEGCYVYDEHGSAKIDGLSGLYCTNVGHSFGAELGQAAYDQMAELVPAKIDRIQGVERTNTMMAFRIYSRHDLEYLFSLGADEELRYRRAHSLAETRTTSSAD